MKKLVSLLTVLFCAATINSAKAQSLTHEGIDFWVAYPEVYDATAATFEIHISSRFTTTAEVFVAGLSTGIYAVTPGLVTTAPISSLDAHNGVEQVPVPRAIHVVAVDPVAVYAYTQRTYRSEATVCLPTASLGSDYMVTTYDNNLKGGTVYESEFVIVCGPNPIQVAVTPSCITSEGSPAGVPIIVDLVADEFWLMQAQAVAGLDLTGTTVTATNGTDIFAVFNGHRWNYESTGTCTNQNADPLLEAAYPTPSWGKEFVAVRTEDQDDNVMRVTTLVDDCDVIVDGTTIGTLLLAGDVIEFLMSSPEIFIETTQPANVTQNMETGVCGTNGDPAMVILNSNEQMYIDTATFLTPTGYDDNYVTIVTRTAETADLTLDDLPISSWLVVDYDPTYSYAIEPVAEASHTVATTGCGFVAYAYGVKYAESYFYAAGVRVNSISDSLSFTSITGTGSDQCDGNVIAFTPYTSGGTVVSYNWDFGDGGTSTDITPTYTYGGAGVYEVTLIVIYECFVDTIVDTLSIYLSPTHTSTFNNVTCYGWDDGSIDITPSGGTPGYTFDWTPTGATTEDVSGLPPGTYTVTVTDINGCTSEETFIITEPAEIIVNVSPAGPFDMTDGIQNLTGTPSGGTWSGDCGPCINATTGEFDPLVAGVGIWTICYSVGTVPCDIEDCITIIVDTSCAIAWYGSNPTCYGFSDGSATVNISGGAGPITYIITDASGTVVNVGGANTANSLPEGWYYFDVSDDICSLSGSIYIDAPEQMSLDLDLSHVLCSGDLTGSVAVDTVNDHTGDWDMITYIWSNGTSGLNLDSMYNEGAGTYTITVTDENGCSYVESFDILEPPPLVFSEIGYEPAYCRLYGYQNGNGQVYAAGSGGTPDYTYEWFNYYELTTTNNTTWGGLNPGTYIMTVTDGNGCTLSQTVVVDSVSPNADFDMASAGFTGQWEGTAELCVEFTNQSTFFANPLNPIADTSGWWNFDSPNGDWILYTDSDGFYEVYDTCYNEGGEYLVCLKIKNKNGCQDSLCQTIIVYDKPILVTPNIFTPGPDGINSTFFFPNVAMVDFSCTIVNRWGVKIFEFEGIDDEWDGTDRSGSDCSDGVYFYIYKGVSTNGTEFKGQGTVQLLREQ
ncbi:gliding motility-associated C-terminal domain-containing protein [Crocinitomix catalasitica]|nr:gliding motility-associated C-terminal domain-containing protein [Crocinitomix catalasitica]